MGPSLRSTRLQVTLLALLAGSGLAHSEARALEASPSTATDGVYRLSWEAPATSKSLVLLEQRDGGEERPVYQGTDLSLLLSGKADGTYRYRIEGREGSATVVVGHHSLARAVSFFGVGAAVFLATVLLVVRGERSGRTDSV